MEHPIFARVAIYCLLPLLSLVAAGAVNRFTRDTGDITDHETDSISESQSRYEVEESNCIWRKEQLEVPYEHAPDAIEPDLSELVLQYRSKQLRASYNLPNAAEQFAAQYQAEPGRGLVIYLHGFFPEPSWIDYDNITGILINNYNTSTLMLDASSLFGWYYTHSNTFIRFIGEKLGNMLNNLIKKGLEPRRVHLIGHSLGAHVASFAGKHFTNLTGSKVGRISGLDPINSCFSNVAPDLRLTASDAEFVDVIHTDGSMFGFYAPLGHVDFYPNSGYIQCDRHTLCSHTRGNEYFVESVVKPAAFVGRKCTSFYEDICSDDISVMGFSCEDTSRGVYDLSTGIDAPPYGKGLMGSRTKHIIQYLMPLKSIQHSWNKSNRTV